MIGSMEQIARDIAALDKAVAELATELHTAYSHYLNAFGQATRQQLILASYYVCTQGYPEQFLRLPYHQRQQLQQTLRDLADQVQEELLAQLHVPVVPEAPEVFHPNEAIAPGTQTTSDDGDLSLVVSTPASAPALDEKKLTPVHLAQWQQEMERAIAQELKAASHAANRLLQQADILPKKLLDPLLEAATKAEISEAGRNPPNLINLMVEALPEGKREQEPAEELRGHAVMHIVAIHLRMTDIEFADATIAPSRTRIRNLLVQLKTLGQDYQRKQREQAIAAAQAAWRSTWTD